MTEDEKAAPTLRVGLPYLLHAVLSTGQAQVMSEADRHEFHRGFAESIGPWCEQHRKEQRDAIARLRAEGM